MAKRLLDVVLASVALVLTAPVVLAAAAGVFASSPGPVIYRARRVGRDGRTFEMFKLRTMHITGKRDGRITATSDARVFPLGRLMRRWKIDELPQLVNVLRGDMSIIGPRPEDPFFVSRFYTPDQLNTLRVRPGLASPGSLFHATHGHLLLRGSDPDSDYVRELLPIKLALDSVYMQRASLSYDISLMLRTLRITGAKILGRRSFADPPELRDARRLI
jgi:lipopolysaccharide/colanic/teichoic acid biosynthesis glycosyltransferase